MFVNANTDICVFIFVSLSSKASVSLHALASLLQQRDNLGKTVSLELKQPARKNKEDDRYFTVSRYATSDKNKSVKLNS